MPTEMKSRIEGIVSNMKKFRTYFGLNLAYFVLQHTDNLATTLQKKDLNAAQGYSMAKITIETLKNENTDEKFEDFYSKVIESAENLGLEKPINPRKRKLPLKKAASLIS